MGTLVYINLVFKQMYVLPSANFNCLHVLALFGNIVIFIILQKWC